MVDSKKGTRLPLIPLSDFVCFPRTRLRLTVEEPRYRQMVRDLLEHEQEERLVGIVLVKPGGGDRPAEGSGRREIFPGGTAGRVVEVEPQPDGRSSLLLEGDFRFLIHRETGSSPYRQALVEAVDEPWFNQRDAGVVAVRNEILEVVEQVVEESAGQFPVGPEELAELAEDWDFEALVNRLAMELDVPAMKKLQMLVASLPERALLLLSILKARLHVFDLLRPYRPLGERPELN